MDARTVHLWNFGDGNETATIDLGRDRSFLAWGSITFTDPLTDYDEDNAAAIEVYRIDGERTWVAAFGGDHLGSEGSASNLRPGALRGFGRRITFRLRTFHVNDLENYGVGVVLLLD